MGPRDATCYSEAEAKAERGFSPERLVKGAYDFFKDYASEWGPRCDGGAKVGAKLRAKREG